MTYSIQLETDFETQTRCGIFVGVEPLGVDACFVKPTQITTRCMPLLVWLVNPSFMRRKDLFVGEGVDLSVYAAVGGLAKAV